MFPKISIITPSYNQGKFLEETILSVINQSYPNLEYIIIDGGSSDNSVDIIKKYEKYITYWISEKDKGQADAINKGFQKVTGEIISWINSDDIILPNTLNTVADYFKVNPQKEVVYGDLEIINPLGQVIGIKKVIPYDFKTQLYTASLVPQPSTFWRTKVLNKIGNLNPEFNYLLDYEYFLRMGANQIKFGIIKKPLSQFRLQPESKTVKEYKTDFFKDLMDIQKQFVPKYLFNISILKLLKIIYKTRVFLLRALTRGELRPFTNKVFHTKLSA